MATLIKNRQLTTDNWQQLEAGAPVPATGDVIVPLATWLAERETLLARGHVAVWIAPGEEVDALVADLDKLPLIAVHFPKFTDGRGYSTARLLRERHGYKGELRAIGDVLRDNVFYLSRVGFDAIALRADQNTEESLAALNDFTEAYQVSVERPVPLFRRRAANA